MEGLVWVIVAVVLSGGVFNSVDGVGDFRGGGSGGGRGDMV